MLIRRLRSILWRVPLDVEVREELAHHRELRARELIDRGWNEADARAEAARRVAGMETTLMKLGTHRNRSFARREWLDECRQDVRFTWRQARRYPGFTLAAVLTLALGIGSTTAIFSVVHAVVIKPYAYTDPDRVLLAFSMFRGSRGSWSVGNYSYFKERLQSTEQFAASAGMNINLADDGQPERVFGRRVTANFFPLFGVQTALGRTFTDDEDRPGQAKVIVLSDRLWRRRFNQSPSMIGLSIRVNGEPHEVIGIMPPAFDQIGDPAEAWVPAAFTPAQLAMYDEFFLDVYARRRADVSLAQLQDEFGRVAKDLARDHPELNRERGATAEVLSTFLIGDYRLRLYVLLAAVALVLLIACANVANLLLARLAARSRELAIRAAIGAGRRRLVRQVLTESLVLSALGGVAGLLFAWWSVPVLIRLAPDGVPRLSTATLDPTVVAAAGVLVIVSALIVGLLPAWQTTRRTALTDELSEGKGSTSGGLKPWVRQTLIASQAAIVMVVLSGAALLVRSAINLQQQPIGFDTTGVLTANLSLPAAQYGEPARARAAFQHVLERVQSSPGVRLAALDSAPPLTGRGGSNGLVPEGRPFTGDRIQSMSHFVTPGYFSALGITLQKGRVFTAADVRPAPLVMVINETLAREAFGGDDPIGKQMVCCEGTPENPMWKTVVGVVGDVRARGPAQPPRAEFYLPLDQVPEVAWSWIGRTLNVITRGDDTASATTAVREAVRSLDPTLPVYAIRTMDEGLSRTLAQARFNTLLMSMLALTGLVLAALGIYSVIAWLVAQRTREIGVRMALGASARDVITMMSAHGLKPVAIGLVIGLGGALAATRLLQGQLFQIGPRDPLALAGTALVLITIAALASTVPAWRATSIDPSTALRE